MGWIGSSSTNSKPGTHGTFLGNIRLILYELSSVCRPWLFGRSKRCFRAEMLEEVMNLWLGSWWNRISNTDSQLHPTINFHYFLEAGWEGGSNDLETLKAGSLLRFAGGFKVCQHEDKWISLSCYDLRLTLQTPMMHRNGCSPVTCPVSVLLDSGWHFLSLPLQISTEFYLWTPWFLQFNLS